MFVNGYPTIPTKDLGWFTVKCEQRLPELSSYPSVGLLLVAWPYRSVLYESAL